MNTYLEKIYISNARKFSSDVIISCGKEKGATLLLASNGTGKTTVFDCIELALTGSIQRISNNNLFSIINNMHPEMDVRLEFSDEQFCDFHFRKGEKPFIKSNINFINSNINPENIPFLLRLTHLFEQRGNKWFVSSDDNEAGYLLDKLSIGNELMHILNKKTSIISTVTRLKNNAETELNQAKFELNNFIQLLKLKEDAKNALPITPISQLINDLRQIDVSKNKEIENSISSLSNYFMEILMLYQSKFEKSKERKSNLAELSSILKEYFAQQIILKTKNEELIKLKKEEEDATNLINLIHTDILKINKELDSQETEKKNLLFIQQRLYEIDSLNTQKDSVEKELKKNIDKKHYLEKVLINHEVVLAETKKNIDKYNDMLLKRTSLQTELEQKQLHQQAIGRNKKLQISTCVLLLMINKFMSELNNIENLIRKSDSTIYKYEKNTASLQQQLEQLQSTFNAINQAISTIATHIDSTVDTCPLCGQQYTALELQKRIKKSLDLANPAIESIAHQYLDCKKETENLKNEREELYDTYKICQTKIKYLISEFNNIKGEISELSKNLVEYSNIENIEELLDNQCYNIEQEIKLYSEKIVVYPSKENYEKLEKAKMEILNCQKEIELLMSFITKDKSRIIELESLINIYTKQTSDTNKISVNASLQSLSEKNIATRCEFQNITNRMKEQRQLLDITKNKLELITIDINTLKTQQAFIDNKWNEYGLKGYPSINTIEEERKSIEDSLDKYSRILSNLENIKIDVEKWKQSQIYEHYETEIKKKTHGVTENLYYTKLIKKCNESKAKLEKTQMKDEAIRTFFDSMKEEGKNLDTYLEEINPLWKSIFNRVLINPIFLNSQLQKTVSYNKSKASIDTWLHGKNIKVSNIASEAQLTDLQLTFILAMSQKYNWTSWKTLLLDDPTQHHDLVHAAAVFDLLRDYIYALDYQIIMSTHDNLHADFFRRKLQNDEIPVKLWVLQDSEKGVTAQLRE